MKMDPIRSISVISYSVWDSSELSILQRGMWESASNILVSNWISMEQSVWLMSHLTVIAHISESSDTIHIQIPLRDVMEKIGWPSIQMLPCILGNWDHMVPVV